MSTTENSKKEAYNYIFEALSKANKNSTYDLQEASNILACLKVLKPVEEVLEKKE